MEGSYILAATGLAAILVTQREAEYLSCDEAESEAELETAEPDLPLVGQV